MKKLFIIIMSLLLVACGSNNVAYEASVEEIQEEETSTSLWWQGEMGNDKVDFQVHVNLQTVFGKYKIDEREYVFKGVLEDDVIEAKNEFGERLIFKLSETTVYGLNFDSGQSFYASANQVIPGMYDVDLLSGEYLLLDSDYYRGQILEVSGIFDQMLLIKHKVYSPDETLESVDVAFKDDDAFKTYYSKEVLSFEDHNLIFKNQAFTESHKISKPDLQELGLAVTNKEEDFLIWLFSDYLDEVIEGSYDLSGRRPIKGDNFTFQKDGGFYYLEFLDDRRLITNDLSIENYSGQLIQKLGFLGGYKAGINGSLSDFVSDYDIKDQVNADLNKDGLEDIILVLENDSERILLILEKSQGAYKVKLASNKAIMRHDPNGSLDPYENIDVKDDELILQMYGGDSTRWSQVFIFDIQYDYRLIEATLETVGKEVVTYDFVSSDVVVERNNTSILKKKVIQERIDLYHFDYDKLFDTDYR